MSSWVKSIPASALALSIFAICADSAQSGTTITSFTGGGFASKSSKASPAFAKGSETDPQPTAQKLVKGWNYFKCDFVTMVKENGNTVTRIDNPDGTYFTFSTNSSVSMPEQDMMIRACLTTGSDYAIRITNLTTKTWDGISAR